MHFSYLFSFKNHFWLKFIFIFAEINLTTESVSKQKIMSIEQFLRELLIL